MIYIIQVKCQGPIKKKNVKCQGREEKSHGYWAVWILVFPLIIIIFLSLITQKWWIHGDAVWICFQVLFLSLNSYIFE